MNYWIHILLDPYKKHYKSLPNITLALLGYIFHSTNHFYQDQMTETKAYQVLHERIVINEHPNSRNSNELLMFYHDDLTV